MINEQRTLTALYDTRATAEEARDRLLGLGVTNDSVSIRGADTAGSAGADADRDRGFWASLTDIFMPDEDRYTYAEGLQRGGYLLTARVPDGLEDAAIDVLERSGSVDLEERSASWRQSGWTGYEAGSAGAGAAASTGVAYLPEETGARGGVAAASGAGATRAVEGDETLEVVEEQLRVGKREVGRGSVRVRSYVTERPVEEQVDLRQERVSVERRPVDRELAPGEATAAFQERTIEATERGEEAVVSKSARVVEEIGVRKDVERETETVRDTVRRQDVEIEDDRAGGRLTEADNASLTRRP
jgi:uncharacterized protein (TIGR02271 family)